MSISFNGIGSGINTQTLVPALVNLQVGAQQSNLNSNIDKTNSNISSIGQVSSALAALQSSLTNLTSTSTLYSVSATSSNTALFTATANANAVKGSYQVEVNQLAQSQTLASGYLPSNNIGTGTLNINLGTYVSDGSGNTTFTANANTTPINLTISAGTNSLATVAQQINNLDAGVTASVVTDGGGSRLTLTSNQTGTNYAIQVTGTLSALNYDQTSTNVANNQLVQTLAAQDSIVKINGLTLTQSSNTLTSAISGVSLNLLQATPGTVATLNVSPNTTQLTNTINNFIKNYNSTVSLLNSLTRYNSNTKTLGALEGDATVTNLSLKLNSLINSFSAPQNSTIQNLPQLGISFKQDGSLQLDQVKFNKAINSSYSQIGALFAKSATPSATNITTNSVSSTVNPGTYAINFSEYTAGISIAGTIGGEPANSKDGFIFNGQGNLYGLSLNVTSGAVGSQGQVVVADGIAVQLNNLINNYLKGTSTSSTGLLTQRTSQLQKQLTAYNTQQIRLNKQTDILTELYTKQYQNLDTALSTIQTTSGIITNLFASGNNNNNNSNGTASTPKSTSPQTNK